MFKNKILLIIGETESFSNLILCLFINLEIKENNNNLIEIEK